MSWAETPSTIILLGGLGKMRLRSFLSLTGFSDLKQDMLLHTFQSLGRLVNFLSKRTLLGGECRL